jgi:hypothetical protein
MKLRYETLVQRFNRLPQHLRIGIAILVLLLLFLAGTGLGRTLYRMTH